MSDSDEALVPISKAESTVNDTILLGRRHNSHARVACTLCRKRKVRCNAAIYGQPCTNCRLDGAECILLPTRKRLKLSKRRTDKQHPTFESKDNHFQTLTPARSRSSSARTTKPTYQSIEDLHRCISLSDHDVEDVLFSYYTFLTPDTISRLEYTDVKYLESQQCFRVPSRPLLEHFITAFYDNVHPYQPFFDWESFLRAFEDKDFPGSRRFSIFVFQAMLLAASSFVPLTVLQRLGFKDYLTARTAFYSRAKALYDVDHERDSLSSAQGALLLTHYVSSTDAKINSYWMGQAVHHARAINAHIVGVGSPVKTEFCRQLNRLWGCCVVRDRLLAFALQRPMQIEASDIRDFVGIHDFQKGDATKSENGVRADTPPVFPMLYDLSTIFFKIHHTLKSDAISSGATAKVVKDCSSRLDDWFSTAKELLSDRHGTSNAANVQRILILIYYHSAQLILWSHALREALPEQCPLHGQDYDEPKRVETAIRGIDDCLAEINDNGYLSVMPVSIIAFIAPALMWHLLSARLANDFIATDSRKRLNHYLAVLTTLKLRYGGMDRVLGHIRQIVSSAEAYASPTLSPFLPPELQDFQQIDDLNTHGGFQFSFSRSYIQAVVTIKCAFALGKFPEKHELPDPLPTPDSGTGDSCTCDRSDPVWDLPVLEGSSDFLVDSPHLVAKDEDDDWPSGRSESLTALMSAAGLDDLLDLFNDVSKASDSESVD